MSHRFVFLATLTTVVAACVAACGLVSSDEVLRVPSPDRRIDAVLIETNGGATTDFGYHVLVGKSDHRGDEVAWLYGAVRNDNAYGVNLRWASDRELVIEYLRASEERLERGIVQVAGRDVRISLRRGVADPSAPAGGMFYNLEKRKHAGNR